MCSFVVGVAGMQGHGWLCPPPTPAGQIQIPLHSGLPPTQPAISL